MKRGFAAAAIAVLTSVSLLSVTLAQETKTATPKGDRILGISVGPSQDGKYAESFAIAKSVGMQSVTLSLDWSGLEPHSGNYDDTNISIANTFYPENGTSVDLILRPINTDRIELPADLIGQPFNSPEVIRRFERLIDHLFTEMPNLRINSLAIGNEVDDNLGFDDVLWAQYQSFYETVSAYARTKRSGLKIGVVGTFDGLCGPSRDKLRKMNTISDVIMVTYYPLHSDFTVEDPTVVEIDMNRLTALYPGRQIELTEAGYPTGAACKSSDLMQVAFIDSMFAAWDTHADQVTSITFSWLTDLSNEEASGYGTYYGVETVAFHDFLRTLGLRTYPGAGRDKPGFMALRNNAQKRGW